MKKIIFIIAILSITISFAQQRAVFVDGKIKTFSQLPKVWVTPTGKHNGFRKSSESFLYSLGIRNVVQPTLTTYQKRDTMYFDVANDVFKYAIKAFTQEEIDRYDESQLNSDPSANKERKYENDGEQMYSKIKQRIRRKFDKGVITKSESKKIRRLLNPTFSYLKTGDWDIAQDKLNSITSITEPKLIILLDKAKEWVDKYITDNY